MTDSEHFEKCGEECHNNNTKRENSSPHVTVAFYKVENGCSQRVRSCLEHNNVSLLASRWSHNRFILQKSERMSEANE